MACVDVSSVKDVKSRLQVFKHAPLLHGRFSHTLTLYLRILLVWTESFSKYFCLFLEERETPDDSSNQIPNLDSRQVF